MKVTYYLDESHHTTAYLEDEVLSDGSYVGVNKHTESPVHLKWDDGTQRWVEVCVREELGYDIRLDRSLVGPPPEGCSCLAREKNKGSNRS